MIDDTPKKSFERMKKYLEENKKKIEQYKAFEMHFEKDVKTLFTGLENDFKNNYENLMHIERFSIPIIGTISSGKSTFLNFLLGINFLESNNDVTTKCVTIIRHAPVESPQIYEVKIEEKENGQWNFLEDKEIKGNPKDIIANKNLKIRNSTNQNQLKREDFFILIKARTSLFIKENSKFYELFQFLDIPGLDEGGKDSEDIRHSKFFKENILTKIIPDSEFSIFLFNGEKFLSEQNINIFKEYISQYYKNKITNSFFILNKIDLFGDKEAQNIEIFKNKILKDELKIDFSETNNHAFFISSTQMIEEKNKNADFLHYVKYIINHNYDKEEKNFKIFLKKKLEKEFNLSKEVFSNTNPNVSEDEKIQIKVKLDEINNMCKSEFQRLINDKDYKKYSEIYEKYKSQSTDEKVNKYLEIINAFFNSFSFVFNKIDSIYKKKSLMIELNN